MHATAGPCTTQQNMLQDIARKSQEHHQHVTKQIASTVMRLTTTLSNPPPLVPLQRPGLAFNFSSTGDGLKAAHHLLLPGMFPTAGQRRFQNADVPILALADDEGCVAGD